jgi:hypothetical protein
MKPTIASQRRAIASRARSVKSAGSFSRNATQSSKSTPTGKYISGSWAEVWSVTMSMGAPIANSSGTISAALPGTSCPLDPRHLPPAGAGCLT